MTPLFTFLQNRVVLEFVFIILFRKVGMDRLVFSYSFNLKTFERSFWMKLMESNNGLTGHSNALSFTLSLSLTHTHTLYLSLAVLPSSWLTENTERKSKRKKKKVWWSVCRIRCWAEIRRWWQRYRGKIKADDIRERRNNQIEKHCHWRVKDT